MNDLMRTSTRGVILDTIRRAKRIARIDLAQATAISQATVTTITAEMIKQGLLEEVARDEPGGQGRRGRPRVDLKLRPDAHTVAGLKIAEKTISVVLADFEGTVFHEYKHPRPEIRVSEAELVAQIQAALEHGTAKAGLQVDDLSGVGIGIAGVVDAVNGLVHWSPYLDENSRSLGPAVQEAVGRPVFIDNDANLVAMAEQYLGDAKDCSTFIVVTIEAGVGMGIVIDNQIYRGARGCGAEFGHTKVQLDGALCRCGQRGCLEAYVADYALLREASFNTALFQGQSPEKSVQQLLAAARAGEPTAQSIVTRSSRIFAMGLANLVNLFDPELIILSGERMSFDHLYAEDVIEMIKSTIVQVDAAPPRVVIHKWGDFMWARGAVAFALVGVVERTLRIGTENAA